MKCRFGRGLLLALLLMILFFYPMLAPPVHRIDADHFALIHNGMSLDEVELILGVPAGHYDWAVPKYPPILSSYPIDASQVSASWISRHGVGTVWFDEHILVVGKNGWGEASVEPPWHNWRNWFKK